MPGITRTVLYVVEAGREKSMVRQSGELRSDADDNGTEVHIDASTGAVIDTDMKKDEQAKARRRAGRKGSKRSCRRS